MKATYIGYLVYNIKSIPTAIISHLFQVIYLQKPNNYYQTP